jgi:hypothetical protein
MCYQKQELLTLQGVHSTPSFSNLVINQKYKKNNVHSVCLIRNRNSYPSRGTFDPVIL